MEAWKIVNGFENYMVSNTGKLKRINKGKEYPLSLNNRDKDGYTKTSMNKDGKRHHLLLHRIVADAFIPNPENHPVVNHINGIKDDNRAENLEWCTISYNTKHAFDVLGRVGQNGGTNHKVTLTYFNGEEFKFNSIRACSEFLGVSETTVARHIERPELARKYNYTIVRDCEGVTTIESTHEFEEASRVDWSLIPIEAQGDVDLDYHV